MAHHSAARAWRWREAGWPAWRRRAILAGSAPDEPATRRALTRALAFQDALWTMFQPIRLRPGSVPDETIVCRCEEVTAGRIRDELANGLTSLPALKKATRAGMGRCQGRFCAATIARLCPDAPDDWSFAAPRAPLRPVPAAPLMFEAPEFEAPLLELPAPPLHLHKLPALPQETRHCDVLVMGGGLAGLCSAYFLAREGVDVLLVERDEAGMAASTANAGSLHVQLLSYDFTDETPDDGGQAAHTLPLAPRSIALWKEIAAEAGEDLGIRTEGGLMLAEDAAEHGMAAPQISDGAALGHRKPRARRQRIAHARPRVVRAYGRRRLRPARRLWRPVARHDGGAETGATCRRPVAARHRGAVDRAQR